MRRRPLPLVLDLPLVMLQVLLLQLVHQAADAVQVAEGGRGGYDRRRRLDLILLFGNVVIDWNVRKIILSNVAKAAKGEIVFTRADDTRRPRPVGSRGGYVVRRRAALVCPTKTTHIRIALYYRQKYFSIPVRRVLWPADRHDAAGTQSQALGDAATIKFEH